MNNHDDYPDARPATPETPPAPPGAEFPGEQLATQLLPWIESVRLIEGEAALLGTAAQASTCGCHAPTRSLRLPNKAAWTIRVGPS